LCIYDIGGIFNHIVIFYKRGKLSSLGKEIVFMSQTAVVKLKQLTQQFGKNVILQNIDLEIYRGEILGLLGPSGSGKTTMVKNIVGMNRPSTGEVIVLNTKVPCLKVIEKVGYMAQSDALYEDLNAMDNLLFFASLYGIKGKEARKKAMELLTLVHLEKECRKPVRNFSGGMKRRLSLAIALIHSPELLILDEPTVGIDPVLRREFWNEFERLKNSGVTILITTHVMDEAEHCDRLAMIRGGKIIAVDTPKELKLSTKENSLEEAFLFYGTDRKER
jgi:ABC-2 type transport system ATP-binding protein